MVSVCRWTASPARPRPELILGIAPWKQGALRRERRQRHGSRYRAAAPPGTRRRRRRRRRRSRLEPRFLLGRPAGRLRRRVGPYLEARRVAVIPGNRLGHPAAAGKHGVQHRRRQVAPGILPGAGPPPALLPREHLGVGRGAGGEGRGSPGRSLYDGPAYRPLPLRTRTRPAAASARECGAAAGATSNPGTANEEAVVELADAGAEWERRGEVLGPGQRPALASLLLPCVSLGSGRCGALSRASCHQSIYNGRSR